MIFLHAGRAIEDFSVVSVGISYVQSD